ncbi:cupin-like domain-containing protein [Caldimonas sp. KR1-144]|uniref:cupin-like domain-containing protein n=1 Tax=Caldimonas sp. KR1-144 TaxID=3400911 RepID=UPI003BFE3611
MKPPPLPPAPRPPRIDAELLPSNWWQWVAENRLRDCTPESMLQTMLAADLPRAACEAALAQIESDPVFAAARRMQQLHRKLESVLANQQRLWERVPYYERVEKRSHVSTDEFMSRYVHGCRPLVITELARDWPALSRWSAADLKQRFGHLDVEVQAERHKDRRYEQNKLELRRTVRLADFVDQVVQGGTTNDYYLTANNEMLRRPEFAPLLADIGSLPEFCDRSALSRACSFWFGPGGTITPLHHDTLMLLHTQVVGRKRWRFVSPLETPRVYNYNGVFSEVDVDAPDLARYPRFAEVKVLEVVLEPGETMFLPLGWWHQVSSLELSLSFSFSNLAFDNTFSYQNPEIQDW